MRKLWLFFACFMLTVPLWGQNAAIEGHSFLGGTAAVTSGQNSTNYLNGIIPSATITVYETGTTTLATIYSDAAGTPLSNPFTSNALGSTNPGGYLFFAAINQGYDVVMSGGIPPNAYTNPVTRVDVFPSTQFIGHPPVVFQHNGTNLPDQTLLNFNDQTPVAPTGFSDVLWQSDTLGDLSAYTPSAVGQIQPAMLPPATGNYVIVYATAYTSPAGIYCHGSGTVSDRSATYGALGGFTGTCEVTWSGFTLPPNIPPSSVTAVYGFSTNNFQTFPYPGSRQLGGQLYCALNNTGAPIIYFPPNAAVNGGTGYGSWPTGNFVTASLGASWSSAVSCTANIQGDESQNSTATFTIENIGLLVYSVDAPAPAQGYINVAGPLDWNAGTNTLSVTANPGGNLTSTVVAALPTAQYVPDQVMLVRDGSTPTDCTVGGGTNFVLCEDGNGTSWTPLPGTTASVTSVAQTVPEWLTVSGSPVTNAGTLAITAATGQTANEFLATPNGSTGSVSLRAIVPSDVPTLNQNTTGQSGTALALAATPAQCVSGQFATGITAAGAANCATPSGSTTVSYGSASGCAFANDGNGLTCTGVTVTLNPAMPNTSYNAVCSANYSNAIITTTSALPSLGLAWTVSSASTISVDEAVASGSSTGFGIASNYGVTVACTAIE